MRWRKSWVVALFFCGGLASGVLTIALGYLSPFIFWFGVSLILTVSLASSLMISQALGLNSVETSWRRYTVSALIMIVAYPITLLVAIEVAFLYSWLFKTFFPGHGTAGDLENDGFFLGLMIAGVIGALLTSVALKTLTRVWSKSIALLLVISGVGTVLISAAVGANAVFSGYSVREDNTIIVVGDALFAALCGHWLMHAYPYRGELIDKKAPT